MYRDGKGTEVNLDLAAEWMNKALENNVGWAKLELLDILIARSGKDDKKRARKLCEELVEENNAGGYGRLARMYRDGWGVDVDLERAKSLMKKAADMGVKWAVTEYSEMIKK
jgi:TPR repeat protein